MGLFSELGTSICFSMYAASSCDALGMMPGSLKDVRKRAHIVNRYKMPPIIGMPSVMRCARNGQSKAKKSPLVPVMSTTVRYKIELFGAVIR